jgi:glycosyltransferase involved in cell wall biosynthesis
MNRNKKVLIIVHEYYPIFNGGVPRCAKFSEYLKCFGWEPIVLTPLWENTRGNPVTAKKDPCEVIRIKTSYSFEDLPLWKRRLRVYTYRWTRSCSDARFIEIETALQKAAEEICSNRQIDVIFSSSLPQYVFRIAHKLHKKFGIPWIADNRDTYRQDSPEYNNIMHKLSIKLDELSNIRRDKQYMKTASNIITVSKGLADLISSRIGKSVDVIPNGFDPKDFETGVKYTGNAKMTIVYTGSFFGERKRSVFFEGVSRAFEKTPEMKEFLSICFYGSSSKITEIDIRTGMIPENVLPVVQCMGTVSHEEAIGVLKSADILYLISHPAKGIATGKIYEYFAAGRPIISVPGDDDITDEMINKSRAGKVAKTPDEVEEVLTKWYLEWKQTGQILLNTDMNYISQFNRKNGTEELAKIFNNAILTSFD